MSAQTYVPSAWAQIKPCRADFDTRAPDAPVHLVQYDCTMPVLEASLYKRGTAYEVPDDAVVNIRMDKRDGHYVYNPALGVSSDRTKVYIAVTAQMTTTAGILHPVVEVTARNGIACSSALALQFDANPVPEDAIASTDEYKTLVQLAEDADAASKAAASSAAAAKNSAIDAASAAKIAGDAATKVIEEGVADKLAQMEDIQTDVKARQEDVTTKQQQVNASVELARQAATANGYIQMGVDPDTGHLLYTRTTNIKDTVNFEIVNDTNLEVHING